jgi:hypothetical protein
MEDIEADYWAVHYRDSKVQEEYENDDENASSDYMAQITREAEEAEAAEAAAAAAGVTQAPEPSAEPVSQPIAEPDLNDPDEWGESVV